MDNHEDAERNFSLAKGPLMIFGSSRPMLLLEGTKKKKAGDDSARIWWKEKGKGRKSFTFINDATSLATN